MWLPGYSVPVETSKGTLPAQVVIDGIETDECPKSLILRSPESCDLIQIINQSQLVKSALGPPSRWPGAMYDAVAILRKQQEIDSQAVKQAIHQAIR